MHLRPDRGFVDRGLLPVGAATPIRALMCSATYSASLATPENRPEPHV